ncbi:hypothetical protein BS47DRAFT_1360643 [Hydnum rufescens UP504]|uniref:Uncharacterized protein n=1 Tax=Hydnum rufescens UP504 TaxID=1448309 RepID=A0A9P6DYL2_9AGAM|nr:hypothetical protein BS47DRAFT_1360643 [Hydnum rufescens UP504]
MSRASITLDVMLKCVGDDSKDPLTVVESGSSLDVAQGLVVLASSAISTWSVQGGAQTLEGEATDEEGPEQVVLSLSSEGCTIVKSQLMDYILWGRELEAMSLLTFVTDTYKESLSESHHTHEQQSSTETNDERTVHVLSNVQFYYECKDAAQRTDGGIREEPGLDDNAQEEADDNDGSVDANSLDGDWSEVARHLETWRAAMESTHQIPKEGDVIADMDIGGVASVGARGGEDETDVRTVFATGQASNASTLIGVNAAELNTDQLCAFNLVVNHLEETLVRHAPDQLLMQLMGKGGTGKSEINNQQISAIKENTQGIDAVLGMQEVPNH